MGHIKMMAAAQPFLSGAISKTVNLPTDCTVEDIEDAYLEAWQLGLKAVAVYRDGCKRSQPLSTSKKIERRRHARRRADGAGCAGRVGGADAGRAGASRWRRRRTRRGRRWRCGASCPTSASSLTHKFSIAGHDGYITVGMYEDGTPGEIFVRMAKEGSTISGLMDSFATAISLALQHGVPLKLLVDKFTHTRFEPSGFTGNPEIPRASSIMDYLFRWLGRKFLAVAAAGAAVAAGR